MTFYGRYYLRLARVVERKIMVDEHFGWGELRHWSYIQEFLPLSVNDLTAGHFLQGLDLFLLFLGQGGTLLQKLLVGFTTIRRH